jgi:hypothetical protein
MAPTPPEGAPLNITARMGSVRNEVEG